MTIKFLRAIDMSKGFGIWQRAILTMFDRHPAVYLVSLLPPAHSRSQVVALNRAARQLANAGKIDVHHWHFATGRPGYIIVMRPGHRIDGDIL
jgi:hypothetical protein